MNCSSILSSLPRRAKEVWGGVEGRVRSERMDDEGSKVGEWMRREVRIREGGEGKGEERR